MTQTPKRIDIIRDKLIGIEMRAHKMEEIAFKARHLDSSQEDEIRRNIRLIGAIYNELWSIINTSEDKGKEWQWWE
jgi:hypothetical protein